MARKKGSQNETTLMLKEAILIAAKNYGDELGGNGLVSFFEHAAGTNLTGFLSLLGKILPMQVSVDPETPLNVVFQNVYQSD